MYLKVLAFYLDALEWDACFRKGWQKLTACSENSDFMTPLPIFKEVTASL